MYGRGVAVSKSDIATYTLCAPRAEGERRAARGDRRAALHLRRGSRRQRRSRVDPRAGPVAPRFRDLRRLLLRHHDGAQRVPASRSRDRRPIRACGAPGYRNRRAGSGDGRAARPLCDSPDLCVDADRPPKASAAPTLTVGLIAGGINTNVVPDKVTFRIDRRIIPEENPADAEATLIRQIRESAAKWPGITCNVRRILLAVPFVPIPGQEKLVAAIARHATPIMGEEVKPHGVPIYTDARLYSTAGIPTVLYGAGPHTLLEANGHRADEKLEARRSVQGDARRRAGACGPARG